MNEIVELIADEKIIIMVRAHWIILARNSAVILLGGMLLPLLLVGFAALFPYSLGVNPTVGTLAVLFWLLLVWIVLFWQWTNYYLTRWLVTNRRIIAIYHGGLFDNRTVAWSTDHVEDVGVRKTGFFQAMFRYGTVTMHILQPVEDYVEIPRIPKPEHVQAIVLKQESRYEELEKANERQEGLLHFLSHEVKGYLTRNIAVFASIIEGDYGAVPQPLHTTAGTALVDTRKGVDTVASILDTSDFKSGAMKMEMHPFDMRDALLQVTGDFMPVARTKGLIFEVTAPASCWVNGDRAKLERHVIRNLIDNAIRYTPSGAVRAELASAAGIVRFSVADTGVGIAPSDMQRLFTQGGKGTDSTKVNTDSTGYGLFVAKSIVEAHGGTIRAASAGSGKGSQFVVELPAVGTATAMRL